LSNRRDKRSNENSATAGGAALLRSEALKSAILETALDCIVTIDHEGRVLDFNPAAERTFGYTRDEALGREMADLIVPAHLRERHRAGLRRAVESGKDTIVGHRIEITAVRKNGEEFPVELAITRIALAGTPLFTGHIRDISERKRAEEQIRQLNQDLERRITAATAELRESQERFSKAFRASPMAISIARLKDGCFVDVNDAFLQGTGYTAAGVIGKTSADLGLWADLEERARVLYELELRGFVRNRESVIRTKAGEKRAILLSAELIEVDSAPHILAVSFDITARKLAEEELRRTLEREQELSRLKTNFVNLVSHEFQRRT
jgi:PAS domain S-box-containing protein